MNRGRNWFSSLVEQVLSHLCVHPPTHATDRRMQCKQAAQTYPLWWLSVMWMVHCRPIVKLVTKKRCPLQLSFFLLRWRSGEKIISRQGWFSWRQRRKTNDKPVKYLEKTTSVVVVWFYSFVRFSPSPVWFTYHHIWSSENGLLLFAIEKAKPKKKKEKLWVICLRSRSRSFARTLFSSPRLAIYIVIQQTSGLYKNR